MSDTTTEPVLLPRVYVWRDIWFTLEATPKGEHWMDFRLFRVESFEGNPESGNPHYWEKGATGNLPGTPDINRAEPFLDGFLKWDGCCEFGRPGEGWRNHLCGIGEVEELAEAMRRIYRVGAELLPGWEG